MSALLGPHQPLLLHTMIRVRDLAAMLDFYCRLLGMQELRRIEFPADRYTLVFIGFGTTGPQVEFWHDWPAATGRHDSRSPATSAHSFHLGIGVRDIAGACAALAAAGVPIRSGPAAMRPGGRVIALLDDPEGNEVELLAAD